MAKVGRPKLVENMEPWELVEHNRREAVKQLTPEQVKVIAETREALRAAFWHLHNYFPQD